MLPFAFLILASFPASALAAEVATEPRWWEVVTGIIAIPAAVIGLVYSIVLIKKTTVEARNMELDLKRREASIGKIPPAAPHLAQALITPLFESKQVQLLLLRFVLLYVTLQLWGLAAGAFNFVLGSAYFGAIKLTTIQSDNPLLMITFLVISNLPKVGELCIALGIGLPLFRDVSGTLGVDLRSIIFFWRKERRHGHGSRPRHVSPDRAKEDDSPALGKGQRPIIKKKKKTGSRSRT